MSQRTTLLLFVICFVCGITIGHLMDVYIYYISKEKSLKKLSNIPMIEVLNATLYSIVFMVEGFNIKSILHCFVTSALVVIGIIDEKTHKIPFILNAFIFAIGICICIMDISNIKEHIIGMFSINLFLSLLHILSNGAAIGGGDIKLMSAAGLLMGWKLIVLAFFMSCFIGAICHVLRMMISKTIRVLAMGPYLSVSIWICILWGNDIILWYL